jgi:hypothetical protein
MIASAIDKVTISRSPFVVFSLGMAFVLFFLWDIFLQVIYGVDYDEWSSSILWIFIS